jgi:hypothetical protein
MRHRPKTSRCDLPPGKGIDHTGTLQIPGRISETFAIFTTFSSMPFDLSGGKRNLKMIYRVPANPSHLPEQTMKLVHEANHAVHLDSRGSFHSNTRSWTPPIPRMIS